MKKFLLALSGALSLSAATAQTVIFHETFDPADSVVATGNPAWTPDATLQTSGLLSYKNAVATNDTSWLTTNAFNTTGNFFVTLDFNHICKIDFFDAAQVQVSNDNGTTWTTLGTADYQGTGILANGTNFNSASYPSDWQPGNNSALPTNAWWKNETFDVSAYLSNAAQCKVRFRLFDTNGNGAFFNYGWVIDDILVTMALSELNPPVITLLPPIYSNTIYSLGPYAVNATIIDASGIDTAYVVYTVNGGPQQTAGMTLVTGNDYQGTIPAMADSDTVCYHVVAIDASPNLNQAQAPSSGCQQFIVSAGITFPYFDDFEGDTLWTVVTQNPGNPPTFWELGLPAYGTTSSTHSGNNAWDINLTSAYGDGVRTAIYSPVFDFSNAVNAKMRFWHNYNTEFGWDGTRLDYTTDGVTWQVLGTVGDPLGVNWFNGTINATSGQPAWNGNSSGWVQSEYELSVLNNVVGPVQFRFLFASDPSVPLDGYTIDDFSISLPSPQDAGVITIVSPDLSSCLPQGTVPLSINLKNYGTQNINGPMPITYVLDANPPVTEMYNDTLVPAAIDTFTFATPLNNTPGTHTLTIYTGLTGDGFMFNDTIVVTYTTAPGVNVPYFNGFENGPSSLNDFCVNTGAYGHADVIAQAANTGTGGVVMDATSSLGWTTFSDTIPTSPYYIWNTNVNADNRANVRLIVNTTGYTNLVMEVDAKLLYQYANEYTNFRIKVNGTMITPHMMPNFTSTPYDNYRYLLTPFLPAPFIIIDFESKTAYDYITGNGIYMDNLYIYEPDSIDAGTLNILQPGAMAMAGSNNTVVVTVRNYGMDTITTMPISYQVNANPPVVETWNGTLLPNATMNYTFTTQFTAATGPNSICAWTGAAGDVNTPNDSTCKSVMGMPVLVAPFIEDFEGTQYFAAETTYSPSWQLGNPVAPDIAGAHSGSNAWEVNLNGPYQLGGNEILYSPFIDFSQVQQAELRFWHWYHMDMYYDGGHVEYSTDGGTTWTVLGTTPDPNGFNWYNYAWVFANNLPGFTGLGNSYVQARYKLAMFNNFPTPVQFRFICASSTFSFARDGWAIDDFEIWVPLNAATNNITMGSSSQLIMPGNNTVKANIRNAGLIALDSVKVTLNIDGNTIVTDDLTFNPTLNVGGTIQHTFSQQWLNAAPGPHTIMVWTSLPNGMTDTNLPDDTTIWNITVFDTVSQYPYCNNFENGNGHPVWAAMNAMRYNQPDQNSFELGSPVKNVITSAHSGANCWVTERMGNYLANDSSGLFTPVFDVQTGACYNFSFWHNYQTPQGTDGGTIEYSTDLGQSWQTFGNMFDPNWFNVTTVTGLGAGTDAFSGNSNYWVQTGHLFSPAQNGNVVFRFRFGSDNAIQSEGWAIDDFCFEEWLSPCATGINEQSANSLQLGDNVPNPATELTMINYFLPEAGEVTIHLRDVLGRELRSYSAEEGRGEHQVNVSVADLPSGVYFYSLTFKGTTLVKKMTVNK